MEFSERYNIEGKMICIDFKKAFDTVSRDFFYSVHCLPLVLDHHLYNGSIRFIITSPVVSLILVFLPTSLQLKEV